MHIKVGGGGDKLGLSRDMLVLAKTYCSVCMRRRSVASTIVIKCPGISAVALTVLVLTRENFL